MGRSHIYLRQLILAASIVATSACGSDQVSVPEQLRGEPACMWIMDTRMHFSDGTSKLIFDEPANQTGAACACLTEAEFESKSRLEELNDMALQICEDLANGTPSE